MSESYQEFVERIWGHAVTREQLEGLLWHCTAFPCIEAKELERQLKMIRVDSGGDYDLAMKQAEDAINKAME